MFLKVDDSNEFLKQRCERVLDNRDKINKTFVTGAATHEQYITRIIGPTPAFKKIF